ncbi:MAG: hypothetical protein J6P84_02590 [Alphaproteobacteria bacterium]|nr:hypothetical protein [Alphaproteobacteria bacterium]
MTISRLRFSMPVLMMLAMESGSAMYNAADIIYLMEHNPPRAADVLLEIDPSRVHVGNPKDFSGEERLLAETVNFMKEKKKSQCEIFLEGAKFLQKKKKEGASKVTVSAVLDYLSGKNINVDKNTFPDEFRDYVEYLNDYYPEDKTDDLPVPMKRTTEDVVAEYLNDYNIASLPEGTDEEIETAKTKLSEVVTILNNKAAASEEATVPATTDDVKSKVVFTFEELGTFVSYMQKEKEVSDKIKVEMTDLEKLEVEVEEYYDSGRKVGDIDKIRAYALAKYFKELDESDGLDEGEKVTSDKVKKKVVGLSESELTYYDLIDFVKYLNEEKGEGLKVQLERTEDEKISDGVNNYIDKYVDEDIANKIKPILEVTVVPVLKIGGTKVIVAAITAAALVGVTLYFDDLVNLIECLIDEGVSGISEPGDDERIAYEVNEYYKATQVGDLTVDQAYDLAMYMRGRTSETTITSESVKTAVPSLEGRTLSYDDLTAFVTHLNAKEEEAQKEALKVTVKRTTKENAGEYLKVKDIASLPEGTDEEIETAKTKLSEVVTILNNKAEASQDEEVPATTDDVKSKVVFTFEELSEFVEYMQDEKVGEVSDKIKVEMTYKEAVTDKISKYEGAVWGLTPAEAYAIVEYLNGLPNNSTVNSDDVEEELKTKLGKDVDIKFADLNAFVEYLKDDLTNKTLTVVKTDSEKIDYAVDTYISEYLPENSITGLPISTDAEKADTKTKLEAIVAYMENPGKDSITSDDVKSNVEGLSGSTINYKDLEQLKTYLHDQGKDLGVTIERTIDEKIDDAVAAYMSNHQVAGQTEQVLKEIVKYLKDQGSATIDRDDVKNYLVTAGKIPSADALTLGYQNLLDLKACSVAEDIELTVNIVKTREEMSDDERIRDEIDEYLDDHTIEDLPTDREEAKDLLFGVVEYLKSLGEPAIVKTSDIYEHEAVTFTYLELREFVNYLKGINEIPSGIEVKRTTAENVAEYLKDTNHTVNGEHKEDEATKTALCAAITILNNKAKASQEAEVVATTDDVKTTVPLTFEELCDFIEYMQQAEVAEVSDKIKVEMTTAERIRVEVDEYYTESHHVGDLTVDQAYALAMYMRRLTSETTITSDSVKEYVDDLSETTFTYDDLDTFVDYLNTKEAAVGKEALKVTVKRTTKENAGEYLKVKNIASLPETTAEEIETAKTKLSEVVTILNNKAAASEEATVPATTDDVKNKVVFTFEELGEFVDYMQKVPEKEVSEKIKVEMTYKEAVTDKISKYAGVVWGLSAAEAYAIVEFLNRQDEGAKVNSDQVEAELKTKLGKDVDIKFSELNAFVEYLNGDLEKTITVVKTDAEKIDSAIAAYYPSHKISGLSDDDAKAALVEIAKHLNTLPPNWKTKSSTIMEELQNAGKIPSTVNLTYDDMVAYIEALDDQTYFENKPMIVEEELTLRQRIDALLLPETPESKLDGVAYDSYRLDSLLTKDGAIDASDVKNTWADAITESFMPALSDANSSILKQDSSIPTTLSAAAEAETQSRIATTTDGSIPTSLKTDIENYVDALYEAETDDMNTALNSILSSNNTLSALNTTESRSTINSKILTDVTANGDAMNAKTNSIYADLPEIVEAIRRYAATYHLTESAQVDQIMSKYPSTEARVIIREYLANKIFTESDANAKGYLKQYLKDEYVMDSDASYAPSGAINTIYTNIKTGSTASDVTSRLDKINNGIIPVLNNNYIRAFADTEAKTTDETAYGILRDSILIAFWNKSYEGTDLSTDGHRREYVYTKTYSSNGYGYGHYCCIPPEKGDLVKNYLALGDRSGVLSVIDSYIPLSYRGNDDFKNSLCDYLFTAYEKSSDMSVINGSIAHILIYNIGVSPHVWVPSIDLRDARQSWFDYLGKTWNNTVVPSQDSITTKIQNALKNLGSGKTLKAGLKSQLDVSGTSALVNDENEYPVANGTSEIDKKYNYTDDFDNKEKVNILDYTYDKLIGDVRAIDAKTAYEVLKAQANATNNAAIDSLVSSDLREALRSAIAEVTTPADVENAASQVLSSEIASKEESTSDAVKDKYAKIYRSVNIDENTVALEGVTDAVSVNAAFDQAIFGTMNGYLSPNGTAGIFEGVEGGVTGFIDAIYGTDAAAKAAAVRKVAMNWITARGEEFEAAKIAEMLNDIKETRNPSDRLKYQIEAYLSSHDIASLPVEDDAAKAKLVQVVEYLQGLDENATVQTDDITVVSFTFPELKAFVDYFKGKEGIPSTISAVKTEEQKLDSAVADYMKNHSIAGQTEAVIRGIVAYLENPDKDPINSDDVKNHLADQHIIADKDALTLDYQNLIDLKDCLAAQDRSVSTNIERTTEERVRYEVDEYLQPTNPGAEAHTIGDLTRDQAFDLAMYLKGLENKTVTGEVVLDAMPSLSGKTLPYEDLKAFVEYLTDLEGLTVTVVRNESDLRDEINTILASNFRPDSVADGVAFDDTVFDELIGGTEEVSGADVENILLAKTASNVFSANADWWKQDASAVSDAASLDSQITAVFPNSVLASEGDDGYDTLQTGIQSFVDAYNSSTAATAGNTELSNILTESNKLSALNLTSTRSTIKTSLESSETVNSKVNAFHNALQTSARGVRDYALAYVMEDAESRQDLLDYTSSYIQSNINSIIATKRANYATKIVNNKASGNVGVAKKYIRSYLKLSEFYRSPDDDKVSRWSLDMPGAIYEKIGSSGTNESRVNEAIKDAWGQIYVRFVKNTTDEGKRVMELLDDFDTYNKQYGSSGPYWQIKLDAFYNYVHPLIYCNSSTIQQIKNLVDAGNDTQDNIGTLVETMLPTDIRTGTRFADVGIAFKGYFYNGVATSGPLNGLKGQSEDVFIERYKLILRYTGLDTYSWRQDMGSFLWANQLVLGAFAGTTVPESFSDAQKTRIQNYIATKGDKTTKISALKTLLSDSSSSLTGDNHLVCLARLKASDYNWSARNESGAWYLAPGDKYDSTDKSVTTINYTYGNIKTPLDEIDKSATYTALGDAVKTTRTNALKTGEILDNSLANGVVNNTLGVVDSAAVRDAIYSTLAANISDSAVQEGFTKMYRGRQLGTHTISGDTQSDVRNSVDSQIAAGIMRYLGRDMILSDYQKSALVTAVDAAVGESSADQQSAIENYLHFSASKAAKIAAILNELRMAVKDKD